jgi:hypothetical protein
MNASKNNKQINNPLRWHHNTAHPDNISTVELQKLAIDHCKMTHFYKQQSNTTVQQHHMFQVLNTSEHPQEKLQSHGPDINT